MNIFLPLSVTPKISTDEYNKLSETDDSYTLNDVVGKLGIEQYMDSDLKGEKGHEKLYVDYLGKAVKVIEHEEPQRRGNDVYLSIDKDLQIAVYKLFRAGRLPESYTPILIILDQISIFRSQMSILH